MESLLTTIANYLWRQSWQIALLVVAVGLASWALRNRSAHVRYLLWLLVLAKCLTPPVVEVPLAVLPERGPPAVASIISTTPPQEEMAQTSVEERLPPTPTSAAQEPLHLATRQWLAVGWLAGVAVFTCIALTKAVRTILWLRRERRTLPRTSGDSFDETFRSLRVKRPPRVWLIEGVGQPFVWGILRGDIYLPNRFARMDDDEHRRDILAHEISHVLRFDAAVNILQIIAQGIFWFHPLVWWANQRIRREREQCCDEMAIAHLGARPKDYSSAIVSTLIQAQESTRPVPSLAVAGPAKNIEERIRTMLTPGKKFYKHPSLPVAAVVVLTALLSVPTTVVLTVKAENRPTTEGVDADRIFGNPTHLGPTVNSSAYEWDPYTSADGLSLYFLSRRPGGLGNADIWVTTRRTRDDPWGAPVNLGLPINSPAFEGAPCVSADGLELYFMSNRPGGCGGYDLWVSERATRSDAWGAPVNLGPKVNSAAAENKPSISADSLSLYFSEHIGTGARPGGFGREDIWVTTRKSKNDPWGTPVNLGPTVNSPDADTSPSISTDELSLYFLSDRPGFGGTDIWVTTRKTKDDPWGNPVNLGPTVNSPDGEYNPHISSDGSTLYFVSNRHGSIGGGDDVDIWQVSLKTRRAKEETSAGKEKKQPTKSLHQAAAAGDVEKVKSLISKGAHIDSKDPNGHTPLHLAALHGRVAAAELLISRGADINAKEDWGGGKLGGTPVYHAMTSNSTGRKDVMRLLVKHGAELPPPLLAAYMGDREKVKSLLISGESIRAKDSLGFTPLHAAASGGEKDIVAFLIEKGADVDARDWLGCTPLYYAATQDRADIADLLLAKGANIDARDGDGSTLLRIAIRHENVNAFRLLIRKGADVNAQDRHGWTVLKWAIMDGSMDMIELLISNGADINEKKDKDGWTLVDFAVWNCRKDAVHLLVTRGNYPDTIHTAACRGDLTQVKRYIEDGTDVNTKDGIGRTALHWAVFADTTEVADFLITKGADVNAKANGGIRPLDLAIHSQHMVEFLISRGADVNSKGDSGWTALRLACNNGWSDLVELLIGKGADVNTRDKGGMTPLHGAAGRGRTDIVMLLLKNGADATAKDNQGNTPLSMAEKRGHSEIVELLRKRGAKDESSAGAVDAKPAESLHRAATDGDIEQVKSLLAAGANVNAPDTDPFGTTPLFYAVSKGYTETVEILIAHGAEVNATQKFSGHTPLHIAAANGHEHIVRLLISKGADVNASPASRATPLHRAATQGHREVVRILIEAGARLDLKDWEGKTPLYAAMIERGDDSRTIVELLVAGGAKLPAIHLAGFLGDEQKMRACLEQGTGVNARDDCNSTPLHAAVNGGQTEMVRFLIRQGADIRARDSHGRTALHLAAMHGYTNVMMLLLTSAADLHDRCQDGMTPLHYAAERGHDEVARLLLDKGADINATSPKRGTPLHQAASWARRSTVELLIARGADVNAKDHEGQTPLVCAVLEEDESIATLLVEKGANVNVRDSDGGTPLHEAAWTNDNMVRLLLSKGADVNAKDAKSRTPLHRAADSGRKDAVEALVSQDAEVNAQDDAGRRPLFLARQKGHTEIADVLRKHGAKE
ncbi:MAG: ankyrin repeat domain-containing protein [Phycisphaerae bacterium]|nr:ankyrin repeat domain-containing protein [Phycisphaerae bacterium]